MRIVLICVALLSLAQPAAASDPTLTRKESAHSVVVTLDRLAAIVESKGAKVFARIDHAGGAKSVGMELRPTQALIFGNPKLGTAALQAAQEAGLDLPLRVVVYEAADGKVWLAYRQPAAMGAAHGIPSDSPALMPMSKAIDGLTSAAVKP